MRLHVELPIAPDTHVFAARVPYGYTPLLLLVDPLDGLQVDEYELPAPHSFNIEGLDELIDNNLGTAVRQPPDTCPRLQFSAMDPLFGVSSTITATG